ncbi:MAG: DEAD/DEAH box helicase [Bacteriovoracaceae bacterium]|nr:DEAD/DEAH box helicase [Bacteriovoracaceae bacterium]
MSLETLLFQQSSFILMLAPPGWGKTSLLIELYKKSKFKIIYLSPLRALAEEFYDRLTGIFDSRVMMLRHFNERKKTLEIFTQNEKAMMITTPELLDDGFLQGIKNGLGKIAVVFDEFHLFYYWGETFRLQLWEVAMMVANNNLSVLGLTATMDEQLLKKWETDFLLGMERLFVLDYGNQRLMNLPGKNVVYPFECTKLLRKRFIYELLSEKKRTLLYFCRYREEVKQWIKFCEFRNIPALGCVGGEVCDFVEKLKKYPVPRCIFATSALSHGVNLPSLSSVFISYKVNSKDFLIQMAGRGGRSGENFNLFSMEHLNNESNGFLKKTVLFLKALIFDMFVVRSYLLIKG